MAVKPKATGPATALNFPKTPVIRPKDLNKPLNPPPLNAVVSFPFLPKPPNGLTPTVESTSKVLIALDAALPNFAIVESCSVTVDVNALTAN